MAKLVGGAGGWPVCWAGVVCPWVSFRLMTTTTPSSRTARAAPITITYTRGTRRDRLDAATLSFTGVVRSSPETPNGIFKSYTAMLWCEGSSIKRQSRSAADAFDCVASQLVLPGRGRLRGHRGREKHGCKVNRTTKH